MQDSFGKSGGGNPTKESFVKQLLGSTTNNVMNSGKGGSDEGMNRLYNAINRVSTRIDRNATTELKETRELANQITRLHKSMKTGNRAEHRGNKSETEQNKTLKSIDISIKRLFEEAKKQNTLWFGVSKFSIKAQNQLAKAVEQGIRGGVKNVGGASGATGKALSSGKGGGKSGAAILLGGGGKGSSGGIGGGGVGGGGGVTPDPKLRWGGAGFAAVTAAFKLAKLGSTLAEKLDIGFNKINEGLVVDENAFRENIRQIVYQTRGLTGLNRELEKHYMDVSYAVERTGLSRSKYQELWIKNVQRGIKFEKRLGKQEDENHKRHLKDMKSITMSAGFTAQQLGMSADFTNELFMNMRFGMNMTANQVQNIARGTRAIARDIGLAGDNLQKAIQSAEKLMQQMADVGTLTETAAENIIKMMSAATKNNVGDEMEKIISATTGMMGWIDSSPATKRLLAMASEASGVSITDIRSGAARDDPFKNKALNKGIMDSMQKIFYDVGGGKGNLSKYGVSDKAIKSGDISQILKELNQSNVEGAQQLSERMQVAFERQTGMGIGKAQRLIESIQEQSMSWLEKTNKLNEQMAELKKNGIEDEKELAALKELEIRQAGRTTDMYLHTARQRMELEEQGLSGAALEKKLSERLSGKFVTEGGTEADAQAAAKDYLKSMNDKVTGITGSLIDRLKSLDEQGSSLDKKELFEKFGNGFKNMDQLNAALQSGNKQERNKAVEVLEAMDQAISTQERVMSDDVTAMRQYLMEINQWVRKIAGWVLEKIGPSGVMVMSMGLEVLQTLATGAFLWQGLKGVKKKAAGWLGWGGDDGPDGKAKGKKGDGPDGKPKKGFGESIDDWQKKKGNVPDVDTPGKGRFKGKGKWGRIVGLLAGIGLGGYFMNGSSAEGAETASAETGTQKALGAGLTGLTVADVGMDATELGKMTGVGKVGSKLGIGGLLAKIGLGGAEAGKVASIGAKGAKFLGPLGVALEAGLGAAYAEDYGHGKTEGALYGALTGGNYSGSIFSGMFGIGEGSNADEAMGVGTAMVHGAMTGTMLGGPLGAGIGALVAEIAEITKITVNAHREVNKMGERLDKSVKSQEERNKKSIEEAMKITDPKKKLAELQRKLEGKEILRKGQESNVKGSEHDFRSTWIKSTLNPAYNARLKSLESDREQLALTDSAIAELKKEIKEQSKNVETTAETMKQGQEKGSIYVHDTHVEALLIMLLKHFDAWGEGSQADYEKLEASLKNKENKAGGASYAMLGAFEKFSKGDSMVGGASEEEIKNGFERTVFKVNSIDQIKSIIAEASGVKGDNKSQTSSTMDYRESTNAITKIMSNGQLEDAISAKLANSSGVQSIIEQIKNDEDKSSHEMFQMMVDLLARIADNTTAEQFQQIVGNTKFGVPPVRGGNIRRTSTDLLSGTWNLQGAASSPTTSKSTGRGMN